MAVAEETRRARSCGLCAARKAAFPRKGEQDHAGALPSLLIDVVHRVTTDAGRLSASWYAGLVSEGLTPESYVEALGVAVLVISIDEFHHAMGILPEPLPGAQPGEPSRYRPLGAEVEAGAAWVPILAPGRCGPNDADLFAGIPGGQAPNVIRALSRRVKGWRGTVDVAQLLPPLSVGGASLSTS